MPVMRRNCEYEKKDRGGREGDKGKSDAKSGK